jgi:hypothetical protein
MTAEFVHVNVLSPNTRIAWTDVTSRNHEAVVRPDPNLPAAMVGFVRVIEMVDDNELVQFLPAGWLVEVVERA